LAKVRLRPDDPLAVALRLHLVARTTREDQPLPALLRPLRQLMEITHASDGSIEPSPDDHVELAELLGQPRPQHRPPERADLGRRNVEILGNSDDLQIPPLRLSLGRGELALRAGRLVGHPAEPDDKQCSVHTRTYRFDSPATAAGPRSTTRSPAPWSRSKTAAWACRVRRSAAPGATHTWVTS